ncbi:SIS domain-containing protein [Salmonella enterica]|uniref:SIS domain-containing protein n=1 Tax=Salmonella enterica TaxID=28901 RepID=A0A747RXQ1_SALER|nr:SIS domain-containing protein [Salmonella enterica]EBQ5830056.1 SIS domain-containing protein [Salmonella enterica subsp. enterica serovar Gatuni]EBX0571940.1 glucosamine--fructose-6-phosphate aminotransferase [Salmonella enterica subsp. enterica serovar Utah]EDU5439436.1 SIS domain-containing protein [Salmonella enterica subsp. enterica serovar Hadar]EEJ6537915.1 SIS domain-containing protein [Salmonella enterica subsp. enterica]
MSLTMLTYINEESDVLANIILRHRQSLEEVSRFASQKTLRRILILATGSSLNAAFCARYFFERCGISIDIKEPYTFSHYENSDPQADMVIAISQSGKSASTLEAMRKVQAQGRPVFALTADPQSPFGKASDYPLDILTGIESVGFVTRGFSATVLNLLLIALLIARQQQRLTESQVEEYVAQLQRIAATLPLVIVRTEAFIHQHQSVLRNGTRFVAIGYGALVGVAKELETKFTETVRVPSSGFELEAYMHGPYLEANAEHVMFFFEDRPDARSRALREYMTPAVAKTFTLTLAKAAQDDQTLALDVAVDHHFSPLLLIVPVQLMAFHIASLKGIDLSVRIFDDFDRVLKSKI